MDCGTINGIGSSISTGRDGHVGVTAEDNRLFVEAVLYRYRAAYHGAICRNDLALEKRSHPI